jgi:hypothetical protein
MMARRIGVQKFKTAIVGLLAMSYAAQLIVAVGVASQYSFYQQASQGVAVDFYISIILLPLQFLISFLMLRPNILRRAELLYQTSLWTFIGIFIYAGVLLVLHYVLGWNFELGMWREWLPPIISIGLLVGLLGWASKFGGKGVSDSQLRRLAISTAIVFILTFLLRPFLALYRIAIYEGPGESEFLLNLMLSNFEVIYINTAPFVYALLLLMVAYFVSRRVEASARSFVAAISVGIALVVVQVVRSFGNFFIGSPDSFFYVLIHITSYMVATGTLLYLVRMWAKKGAS